MLALIAGSWLRPGDAIDPYALAARVGWLVASYLLFVLAQRFILKQPLFRRIAIQLNLLVLMLLLMLFLKPLLLRMHPYVGDTVLAASVFLGVMIALKLCDLFFFDLLAQWRNKPQVPLVVRDIGRWAVAAVALVMVVRAFFPGANLNVLAVSSLVVGYIVGNATQDTLGNLISGLALNIEHPFQIGDWVTVGGHTGVVVDTTWRATRLRTKADDHIVIPNSSIAKESIVNFSRPTRSHGCYLAIGVSYETPPNKARQVILGVLAETPEVCSAPAPSVYLSGYGDFAVNFTIRFFITDFARLEPIQSAIMDRLWYAFRRENINIPFPIQDCRERDAHADEREARATTLASIRGLLSGVDLFQTLSAPEMDKLVEGARLQLYAASENLCRQGEAGDSFYIIRSGSVAVWVADAAGKQARVATLESGAFFGEMSLLTGAPRSGTVTADGDVEVVCISKPVFAGLLTADASLAGKLAEVLERRLAERQARLSAVAGAPVVTETKSALLGRMRRFFGMG